jgi:glycosyltransferase involved in cell wall biosynthesis
MPSQPLRIAWIGAGPGASESGGVPGAATELLLGLTALGHEIDCYLTGTERELPERVRRAERLTFYWGTLDWRWNRWYNRTQIGSFVSGMLARGRGSLRLRRTVARAHAEHPYDVVLQFSSLEALGMPSSLKRRVPLVILPETHAAGELRHLIAERALALRCQPLHTYALAVGVTLVRTLVQRRRIGHATLLVCISRVFRDHLVRDYRFPLARTTVIPNPVRIERFAAGDDGRPIGHPATVLALGRISVRKGVEDVIALAHLLRLRGADVRIRVVGGPSLWSDYTKLLTELPPETSEFLGRIQPAEIPAELAQADLLLQASKYEPFGLTVGEALAAGVPVVATSEVGAIEGVDRTVVGEVTPGDVEGLAETVVRMLAQLDRAPRAMRELARAEAVRLFAPSRVCEQLSAELERVVESSRAGGAAETSSVVPRRPQARADRVPTTEPAEAAARPGDH